MTGASSATFLDSNILIYALSKYEPDAVKKSKAGPLLNQSNVWLSTQVVNEVCLYLLKTAKLKEGQLASLIKSMHQKYNIVPVSQDTMLAASRLRQRYSLSFWDSLVVAAAVQANVDILYSEDMHHGLKIEGLRIVNPFR